MEKSTEFGFQKILVDMKAGGVYGIMMLEGRVIRWLGPPGGSRADGAAMEGKIGPEWAFLAYFRVTNSVATLETATFPTDAPGMMTHSHGGFSVGVLSRFRVGTAVAGL